jgi:hypothetical protein
MAGQAKVALGSGQIEVQPDRGYFDSEEIPACETLGLRPQGATSASSGE